MPAPANAPAKALCYTQAANQTIKYFLGDAGGVGAPTLFGRAHQRGGRLDG
jgi:hypothetical protein